MATDWKIDKNVELPPPTRGIRAPSPLRTALESCEVGDSFLAPTAGKDKIRPSSVRDIAKHLNFGVSIRVIDPTTIRIWRTK